MASDTAAKEVLAFAKNRLNKFYNPKLYKAPPRTDLSAEGARWYCGHWHLVRAGVAAHAEQGSTRPPSGDVGRILHQV